jgi:hypothetical protein
MRAFAQQILLKAAVSVKATGTRFRAPSALSLCFTLSVLNRTARLHKTECLIFCEGLRTSKSNPSKFAQIARLFKDCREKAEKHALVSWS